MCYCRSEMLFLLDIQNLALLTDLLLHSSQACLQQQVFVLCLQSPELTHLTRADTAMLCSAECTQCFCQSPAAAPTLFQMSISGRETCLPGLEQKERAVLNWGNE